MQNVELKAVLTGVRPGGCVQPYLMSFADELISAGYTLLYGRDFMRSAVHLGRWMDSRNIGIGGLKQATITRFTRHKCQCPGVGRHGQCPSGRTVARVRQFTEHLIRLGAVLPPTPSSPRSLPSALTGFRDWMTGQRGIKVRTIDRYEWLIEKMLPVLGGNPMRYDASSVRQSLLRTIKELSCGYAKTYVIVLRAFLRFLAAQGRCPTHLDRAVPIVPEWKLSALPRYLETEDVERLIASCDLTSLVESGIAPFSSC